MQVAYCDESEDTNGQRLVYVVSGYLGSPQEWFELERRWKRALAEENIPEFHMSWCENRLKHFEPMEREQRDHLQRRFIDIISATAIWGFSSAIHLQPYSALSERIRQNRGDVFAKPYYLAFQHQIEMMAIALDESPLAASDERIAFVFDQQKEYEGHAKALYESLSAKGVETPYFHRLGSIGFDSRLSAIALQAADVFAYENLRYVREVEIGGQEARWQWERLNNTKRNQGRMFTEEELVKLMTSAGW